MNTLVMVGIQVAFVCFELRTDEETPTPVELGECSMSGAAVSVSTSCEHDFASVRYAGPLIRAHNPSSHHAKGGHPIHLHINHSLHNYTDCTRIQQLSSNQPLLTLRVVQETGRD